ncbi:unnamed protein product [Didymodactylos carnosus]|uniref:Uncharacterized protein n=1 Tax=Didymodactylos carnosus TaxID=1234261 RepID=A0A8S2KWH0_9BILA|nr:unnamed protein product [Didymodactylos carnosus]CAF3873488.1 unnamed protein product [Didymodactylos carnosus]
MAIEKCCNVTELSRVDPRQWLICDSLLRDCEAEEDVIRFVMENINVFKYINLTKLFTEKLANLTSSSNSGGSINFDERPVKKVSSEAGQRLTYVTVNNYSYDISHETTI